jgi:soluble lytic murein transglycosylase-like protein
VVRHGSSRRGRKWQGREDFRTICDCQRHARRERSLLRRAARVASHGIAVLVSIPLAFAAFDIPTSAMNIDLDGVRKFDLRAPKIAVARPEQEPAPRELPIFTTREVREKFLDPNVITPTLDVFKEEYFRRHVPYGDIIFREARRNNLAPELVAAVVHTESDFRATLVSHKSAQGLMQIVPDTARILGIRDPFDPQQNIAAGTKYLRYLMNRYQNETMALAAYNAGPGNVARFGGIPPFGETRSYIAKVNRRTNRYRQRVHNNYLATLRVRSAAVSAY